MIPEGPTLTVNGDRRYLPPPVNKGPPPILTTIGYFFINRGDPCFPLFQCAVGACNRTSAQSSAKVQRSLLAVKRNLALVRVVAVAQVPLQLCTVPRFAPWEAKVAHCLGRHRRNSTSTA